MIPTGSWLNTEVKFPFITYDKPLPKQRFNKICNVKIGPMLLSQSGGRLDSKYWMVYQQTDKVVIRGAVDSNTWSEAVELFTETSPIIALSLSFDNLGRPVVFYQKATGLFLWFYDSQLGDVTIKAISSTGITPMIDFDIKEDTSSPNSDIMMYYVENDTVYQRLQRDRFDVVYPTGISQYKIKLTGIGNTVDNRFQVSYRYPIRSA